jgi:hypothetical protein
LRHRQRMVVLHKLRGDPMFRQRARAVAFGEKSTVIAEAGGGDDENARERGLFYLHGNECDPFVINYEKQYAKMNYSFAT